MPGNEGPEIPEKPEELPEGEEAPPRGVRWMAAARWMILGVAILLAASTWWTYAHSAHGAGAETSHARAKYFCPMHPQIVSDEPGECPICHMTLEPMPVDREESRRTGTTSSPDAGVRSDAQPAPSSTAAILLPGSTPPGTVRIKLALDRVQSIGVRTAVATERTVSAGLRATAVVTPTEQGVAEIHVRSAGFVESLFVDQTGVSVVRGQPLFNLYSPEIFQAESELLSVRQWAKEDAGGRSLEAARRKLELLGVAAKDIDRVVERGEATRALPVYAPQNGYIAKKNVVAGSYVTPEMALYEIQDLSRVYVVADVFERDLGALHVGAAGTFTSARGETAHGKVDLIYPTLNSQARTTRVRMQLPNAKRALQPGEFGTVELSAAPRAMLLVPLDAVVDTGTYTYVFVVESEGSFSPRLVVLGGEVENLVAVRAGLSPGDRVVSGATFLVDSESRLQASISEVEPVVKTAISKPGR